MVTMSDAWTRSEAVRKTVRVTFIQLPGMPTNKLPVEEVVVVAAAATEVDVEEVGLVILVWSQSAGMTWILAKTIAAAAWNCKEAEGEGTMSRARGVKKACFKS
jgi:hypothetical protein